MDGGLSEKGNGEEAVIPSCNFVIVAVFATTKKEKRSKAKAVGVGNIFFSAILPSTRTSPSSCLILS